jgi:hypothetical protein
LIAINGIAVLVPVSFNINTRAGLAVEAPAGFDFKTDVTETESVTAADKAVSEKVPAVVESVAAPVSPAVPLVVDNVSGAVDRPVNVACEGAELRTPRPKAATATSAMRLKFVFVDMYFLSLVVTRNFLVAASR